jgi:hypothetical protein
LPAKTFSRWSARHRIAGSPLVQPEDRMNRLARSALGLSLVGLSLFGAAGLFGCVPGTLVDSAQNQAGAAIPAGSYWVVETDAGLDLFQMPAYRGDAGKWQTLMGLPNWYTRDGLYSQDATGNWTLEIDGAETDLDSLLQVWDAPPPTS